MSTYAIGDVQGCYAELMALLNKINFGSQDTLWFVGDIVNRGPHSLATLRFVKSLGERAKVVLGNHDIHLIAVHYGVRNEKPLDTLQDILSAPDRDELIDWLKNQPLLYHDVKLNFTMTHAGVAPMWDLTKAEQLAYEFNQALQSPNVKTILLEVFSDPLASNFWQDSLTHADRLRTIVNYFTRMRFCDQNGKMDLKAKGPIEAAPDGYMPWFKVPHRKMAEDNIVFGHWAMLKGKTQTEHTFAIDTGCAWGESLTALRLDDQTCFSVPSEQAKLS